MPKKLQQAKTNPVKQGDHPNRNANQLSLWSFCRAMAGRCKIFRARNPQIFHRAPGSISPTNAASGSRGGGMRRKNSLSL
jgi:hypothetical protein